MRGMGSFAVGQHWVIITHRKQTVALEMAQREKRCGLGMRMGV